VAAAVAVVAVAAPAVAHSELAPGVAESAAVAAEAAAEVRLRPDGTAPVKA